MRQVPERETRSAVYFPYTPSRFENPPPLLRQVFCGAVRTVLCNSGLIGPRPNNPPKARQKTHLRRGTH